MLHIRMSFTKFKEDLNVGTAKDSGKIYVSCSSRQEALGLASVNRPLRPCLGFCPHLYLYFFKVFCAAGIDLHGDLYI